MRASRSLASVGRWNPAAAGLAVFASATRVANRTWSTDLTIERGVIPCCSLYASCTSRRRLISSRSEEHTSELQSLAYLVCRLLLEKKKLGEAAAEARQHVTAVELAVLVN